MRSLTTRLKRRRLWASVVAIGLVALPLVPIAIQAQPASAEQEYLSQELGFDSCTLPTVSQMQAWWTYSPYSNFFGYLGGANFTCGSANQMTNSWVQTVDCAHCGLYPTMEWDVGAFWVGPQLGVLSGGLGCGTLNHYNTYISTNTSTAYNQGYNEAVSALETVQNQGFNYNNFPISYDLEAYTANSGCRAAAQAFMHGFADFLKAPPSQMVGAYGSSCGSYIADLASDGNVPDYIHGAYYDGNIHTSDLACVPSGYWTNNQRHKQYAGTHNETWGNVTLSIDNDCSNGPVYGQFYQSLDGRCV